MSKKMKGVVLDSPSYAASEDARAMAKHQSLQQDYEELYRETEASKRKLNRMNQKKLTLLAEVEFLRRRYKYLLQNQTSISPGAQDVAPGSSAETRCKSTSKEKKGKKAAPRKAVTALDEPAVALGKPVTALQQPISTPRQPISAPRKPVAAAVRQPVAAAVRQPVAAAVRKPVAAAVRQPVAAAVRQPVAAAVRQPVAALRHPVPRFDLNTQERSCKGNEIVPESPIYAGNEAIQDSSPIITSNQDRVHSGKEAARPSPIPVFDLNQISREEEELQDNSELSGMEDPKNSKSGNDEQHVDMKVSACRNIGSSSSRSGKRKISWQDPVALRV